MPHHCKDVRDFLKKLQAQSKSLDETAKNHPGATVKKSVIIYNKDGKRSGKPSFTKFKLRTNKGLFTVVVSDKSRAKQIEQALLPMYEKKHLPKK